MQLLLQLVWLGTTINQRYKLIVEIGDVAAEAASHAIDLKAYDHALEWLEAGRSIVWGQILQLRTPFNELFAEDPVLAKRLKEVGRKLEDAGSESTYMAAPANQGPATNLEKDSKHIHDLVSEWDKLLQEARQIPGFQNFMRPRKAKELMHAAKHGSVAIINIHKTRCDALIVQQHSHNVAHVPLESFSMEKAIDAYKYLLPSDGQRGLTLIKRSPPPKQKPEQVLETLWCDIVKPVLDFLGYKQKLPIDQLPCLTWCATGLLSFLPLHATGCCDQSHLNVYDLVISSYTPTLGALLAHPNTTPRLHCGVLAVGQEHTPGFCSLPCTKDEPAVVKNHAEAHCYLQLDNDEATIDQVLDAMDEFSWVHMACHGTQNSTDPTLSAFHLHDGGLTLATITRRAFKNKGLAFLSACQTATGDKHLPGEAVHLAAGMLMSGYPSVIGTMWSIADEDGPEVAAQVYSELLKDGEMDHTKVAYALHKAVAELRAKVGEKDFQRWAPFIHIGS